MTLNDILANGTSADKSNSIKEFNKLKKMLNLNGNTSEHEFIATCRILKHMQTELNISPQTPIRELVSLYNKLTEVRAVFDLETNNFNQLNELFIEIITVREMADIPKDQSLPELLIKLRSKKLSAYGIGENSLLEKLLRYQIQK
ncbi:MAG: hypothetical protein ACXACU_12220 [Candidatus Hodarchaeales archaeon]